MMAPEPASVDDLLAMVNRDASMPASQLYALAAIEEGVLYLNGSP